MAESDAGNAGMTEQLRRLFPDEKWPEYPYRPRSRRICIDQEVAGPLLTLLPNWDGAWTDFAPWLRECSYMPSELPELHVKTISAAVAKAVQQAKEKRISLGLVPTCSYGTSVSTFVTAPRLGMSLSQSAGEASGVVQVVASKLVSEQVIECAAVQTDLRKTILVAMLAMDACTERETARQEAIQSALRYVGHQVGNSFASHSKALRGDGLIESQRIRPYGYWLTSKGKAVAEYLCERDRFFAGVRASLQKKWQQGDLVGCRQTA